MRWLPAACILVAASPARAGTDDDDALTPTKLSAKLAATNGATATITARFEVVVNGPATEQSNQLRLDVPERAVVTGATVREHGHVERLQLARLASVDEKFSALAFGRSNGTDRRWGIRIDVANEEATVGVAAPHAATLTLDVTFEAPTCFFDDVRYVQLPTAWVERRPARSVPTRPSDEISEACADGVDSDWLAFPSRDLGTRPGGEARIGIVASRLSVASQDLARLELALARELTDIPGDLYTAIVVDHSRSLTAAQRENQRAVVEAYLRAAPRGRVQVIGYARNAAPLLSGWMNANRAAARIDRAIRGLPPRNGSNLDEGLAVAGAWLANITGTRRVIVFTDERLAHRISDDPVALRAALPEHTLVHVVDVFGGDGTLVRSDDALLSPLALATGGIGVSGGPDEDGNVDALLLARPTSFDNLSIKGAGWEESTHERRPCPLENDPAFSEGRSCVWWGTGTPTSGDLTITGSLWGTTVTKTVRPDASRARSVARILTTIEDLDIDLLHEVETAAFAVNSVWSLFAMWGPGGGYDEVEMSGTIGLSGFSCCHTIGTTSRDFGTGTFASRPHDEVRRQLAGAVTRCNPRSEITIRLETTLDEIIAVDVDVRDRDAAVRDCITEGVWDTSLSLVQPPSFSRWKVSFQPT